MDPKFFKLSPDGDGQGGAPPAVVPPIPPVAAPAAAGNEPANPSHKDWNGLATSMRAMADGQKALIDSLSKLAPAPAEKVAPATTGNAAADAALAEARELTANANFREAAADADVKGAQRDLLKLAWVGAGRPANVVEWIAANRAAFGSAPVGTPAAVVPAPTVVVPPKAPSDTGPPVALSAAGSLDGDPRNWPNEIMSKKSGAELRQAIQEYDARGGGSQVLAAFREMRAKLDENRTKTSR